MKQLLFIALITLATSGISCSHYAKKSCCSGKTECSTSKECKKKDCKNSECATNKKDKCKSADCKKKECKDGECKSKKKK